MGNCQAAEAVVILHPGGNKVERIYSSVSANEVMNSHPGYYVAVLKSENGSTTTTKRLKLLRPDENLMVGQVYRLICFEDVLKQFTVKKCVKLGKLLKERGALKDMDQFMKIHSASDLQLNSESRIGDSIKKEEMHERLGKNGRSSRRGVRRSNGGVRQWKPALHSISEQQQLGT